MKVLCENVNDYLFFSYIVNTISILPEVSIAMLHDKNQLMQALNHVNPKLILLNHSSVTAEVKAYKYKYKAKLIVFGDHIDPEYDFIITKNMFNQKDNIVTDKVLANFNIIKNTYYDEKLSSLLTIMTGPNTKENLIDIVAKNYNVKIFGNKRINSPRFLGKINPEQRNTILKSSKYLLDFGTYDYLDSSLLGGLPIIYTNSETPDYVYKFWDMVSLIQVLDYLLDPINELEIENKRKEFYNNVIENTSLDLTCKILKELDFVKQSNDLLNIKKEILIS